MKLHGKKTFRPHESCLLFVLMQSQMLFFMQNCQENMSKISVWCYSPANNHWEKRISIVWYEFLTCLTLFGNVIIKQTIILRSSFISVCRCASGVSADGSLHKFGFRKFKSFGQLRILQFTLSWLAEQTDPDGGTWKKTQVSMMVSKGF